MDLKKMTLSVVTVLVRIVGGGFCLAGTAFVLWALISEEDRWVHAILGILSLAIGVGALVAGPPSTELLQRIRKHLENN